MELTELVRAIQTLNTEDALRANLGFDQWRTLAAYLTRHELRAGEMLIKQDESDRIMYFLERGSLHVYVSGGTPGTHQIAILRAGSVVGEPSMFSSGGRMANVETMSPCVVWALQLPRLEEMAQRSPALALELLRAAGSVMSIRMRANLAKHTPFT